VKDEWPEGLREESENKANAMSDWVEVIERLQPSPMDAKTTASDG
jgi:hypothetical protein